MTEDTLLPFDLPAVRRKKVTADFEGGLISSDGGLVLLREAERRLGLAETLAGCIRDWRDPALVVHTRSAMLRFRMFAIACGYEDADDCDALRTDPLFKLAVGQAPVSGRPLCSQPTMSRLENAPSRLEVARMTAALVDVFCRSFAAPPAAITLDIDDTCDPVHGHQQLSLFNAHYDTRCFLPVHVYHVDSGKPVAVLLRPGKTPSGAEIRTLLKHLVRRIRRHWPRTRLTFRGDSHYGRPEAMTWCEANGVDYIFGLAGNPVLHRLAYDVADDLRPRRAEAAADRMRGFAAFPYAARSWKRERRVVARLEATARGFDARYIVTSLGGEASHLYEAIYCPRPGREPDQAAQGPARLGPHLRSEPARQPVQAGPAHRGLLADARPARRRAPQDGARLGRVRHPQPAPAQDRRPHRREGRPHPHPLLEDRVPDAKTVWLYREQLTQAGVIEALFERFDGHLKDQGSLAMGGQIIDASIVAVPTQRNSREENARIKAGETPAGWEDKPAKRRQKDVEARWTKRHGKSQYGYKNHVNVDRRHKLVRRYHVSDAAKHDIDDILDGDNTALGVWADSAYRSAEIEAVLKEKGLRSRIHRKGRRNKPLSEREKRGNKTRSSVRVRVEHVLGAQSNDMGGTLVRSVGLVRAKARIGLKNLAYNMRRLVQLERLAAAV